MLSEVQQVRQVRGDARRRWFSDEHLDLIVWHDDHGQPDGFQFCFDTGNGPHAITWIQGEGYKFNGIDDGEGPFGSSKATPVLILATENCSLESITSRFEDASTGIDPTIRAMVLARLREFNNAPTMPSSVPLTRGTPPAGQESRHGSRSAHG